MDAPGLFSLGYGNRTMPEFLALLEDHRIATLVDVRSVPFSRFHPDFAREALKTHVEATGSAYAWMGDTLGGKCGSDPPSTVRFRSALRRLALMGTDRRVAFLCAEQKPESCHRFHVLSTALANNGIVVHHIDERGILRSHAEVERRLTHGQVTLESIARSARPVLAAA